MNLTGVRIERMNWIKLAEVENFRFPCGIKSYNYHMLRQNQLNISQILNHKSSAYTVI